MPGFSGKSAKSVTQTRSVILTSQMPLARWHEQIGDSTVADGILDRLVHNAHRIQMRCDSMRKNWPKPNHDGGPGGLTSDIERSLKCG